MLGNVEPIETDVHHRLLRRPEELKNLPVVFDYAQLDKYLAHFAVGCVWSINACQPLQRVLSELQVFLDSL